MSQKSVIFLLGAVACLGPAAWADDNSPLLDNDSNKMLGAHGSEIHDHGGSGDVVVLRGVNLGGWLEWQDWMCPIDSGSSLKDNNPGHNGYDFEVRGALAKRFDAETCDSLIGSYEDAWITAKDLDNIKALGLNVVRLTLGYDTIVNQDGSWRSDCFDRLDWLVKNAWNRGIYTIIDFHAFLPPDQDGSATGYFANSDRQNETVQIWTAIANHYKGNPAVAMYDLLNEPNNSSPPGKQKPSAQTVCDLYDQIYQAIRKVDPDHLIAMEGMWDWHTLRDPDENGYRNVVYSFHWYHFGQKNVGENNQWTDNDIKSVAEMQKQWRVPAYIGEFNLFGDAAAWKYALQAYTKAGLSWTMWTYKNKASGENSWGVYTTIPGRAPPVPNLATDSSAEIRSKWLAWRTDNDTFQLNPMLGPVLAPSP
jgi:endoglucanase